MESKQMPINATAITNIFRQEFFKQLDNGATDEQARSRSCEVVKKAGFFLIKGKWVKATPTQKKTKAFKTRSNENSKLAKINIKSDIRMA